MVSSYVNVIFALFVLVTQELIEINIDQTNVFNVDVFTKENIFVVECFLQSCPVLQSHSHL